MATIAENLQATAARIRRAAERAGREPSEVHLVAVAKTHPASRIEEAVRAGQRAFGENYVQEALEKMSLLDNRVPPLEWHLIGPLQSNKTRLAAERFDWVHTVASEKVARRLSEQRPDGRQPLNVLIQVNVSGETTKAGVEPRAVLPLARSISGMKKLRLRGLMAIPEPTDEEALQRKRFSEVKNLLELLRAKGFDVDTLSMGMSDDMEVAILEGATIVRIGTAIFGARASRRELEPCTWGAP